ncbi:MAG: regulatory protein RecX [Chloroflexota bacterium]
MTHDERVPASGVRSHPRKATLAERRAERGEVEDPAKVLDAAARYLEARPRSETEVRRKLRDLGYRSDLVEQTVARLIELGYIDDDAFARTWVDSRDRARPRGEHALRMELMRKGVERTVINGVIDERRETAHGPAAEDATPTAADEAAAARLLERKGAALQRETDPRRRVQRAYALLARNGFSPDVCARIARTVAAGPGPVPVDDDELQADEDTA